MPPRRVGASRVHLPVLGAEILEDWTITEAAALASPSGLTIHLELGPAQDDARVEELLEIRSAAVRELFSATGEVSESVALWCGRATMHSHQFEFQRNGSSPWIGRVSCVVEDGTKLTAFASWSEGNLAAPAELEAALDGVRFLNRPAIEIRSVVPVDAPSRKPRRAPVSRQRWTELRQAWTHDRPARAGGFEATIWSPDELATFATILGAPVFPTVGPEWFASLPEATLRAVLEAVIRSLSAREFVTASADGSIGIVDDDVRSVMETAVYPDLSVAIEARQAGDEVAYFGVRAEHAVRVRVDPKGMRECVKLEVAELVDAVCSFAGFEGGVGDPTRRGRVVTSTELDDVDCDIERMMRIDTAWREGERILGAVLWFARDTGGGWWLGEQSEPTISESVSWILEPTDPVAARELILYSLPGG